MEVYILAGLLWGACAVKQNVYLYKEKAKPVIAFTLNAVFWPLGMFLALIR